MKKIKLIAMFIALSAGAYAQSPGFKLNTLNSVKPGKDDDNTFKTLSIIDFNYLDQEFKAKENDYKAKIDDLYANSKGLNPAGGTYTKYTDAQIDAKKAEIEKLSVEISALKAKTDSLYFLYTKAYLKNKPVNFLNFGPLRSRAFFDLVYQEGGKRFQALGNAGFNIGDQSGSIYSELVSGNLGMLRVSLGAMVSASNKKNDEEAKKQEAYQRLVSNGGNTILSFEYPLAYLHNRTNQYNLISRLIAKGTGDLPAFGTNTEKWAGSGSVGIDVYGDAALSNNALRFFFNLTGSNIYGTGVYRDNLGISSKQFTFGQLSLGLVFLKNFKVSVIVATFSSEGSLANRNPVLGGQILTE
ncbi:hypothetical protein ABDJ41_18560 [Pedobacter sp. ASV1-7]|uniref:hypothetical protein n=1 Tax=Pedobacter sp. ASV1-7 TaxID=3145237 RepID=UPI0032E882D3